MKPIITTSKIAVDTNILIYLHEQTPTFKGEISQLIIRSYPVISSQVISEYINVLNRLLKPPKLILIDHCINLTAECPIVEIKQETLRKARDLIGLYNFQVFDSIIVASALQAGCDILYSEDFQHRQIIENQLTIINPYLTQ